MALHGDICLNKGVMYVWAARRLDNVTTEVNDYEVDLYKPNGDGIKNTIISHAHDDGALALAAKVLAWAAATEEDALAAVAAAENFAYERGVKAGYTARQDAVAVVDILRDALAAIDALEKP